MKSCYYNFRFACIIARKYFYHISVCFPIVPKMSDNTKQTSIENVESEDSKNVTFDVSKPNADTEDNKMENNALEIMNNDTQKGKCGKLSNTINSFFMPKKYVYTHG